jgi:hypothetical protein
MSESPFIFPTTHLLETGISRERIMRLAGLAGAIERDIGTAGHASTRFQPVHPLHRKQLPELRRDRASIPCDELAALRGFESIDDGKQALGREPRCKKPVWFHTHLEWTR